MFGWHLSTSGRPCKLEDIRYSEVEVQYDVEGEDGARVNRVMQRLWFVDEYGTKQGFDEEITMDRDAWDWNNPFYPYYQCGCCLRFLRSWEEAKIHVGDDEDVDEPALQMINDFGR